MTDARMATSPSVRDALVELGGVRALLQVPMLKDGGVVGFIGVWRQEPGAFLGFLAFCHILEEHHRTAAGDRLMGECNNPAVG